MNRPPSAEIRRSGRAGWVQVLLGAMVLLCFALFLFSNTNGDITIQGDDIFFLAHTRPSSWNYFHLVPGRGYLTPFYSLVYDWSGRNTQRAHIFWFVMLVFSALVLYRILTKLLGPLPALIAAIFYLAYTGKHETVTWLSAGAYILAALVLFLSVWIAISPRPGPWSKAILITAINWVVVHLCEILIVAAPLYPLFYWLQNRASGRRTKLRGLAPTFLPLLMFAAHAAVIYENTPRNSPPLWLSRFDSSGGMSLPAALWNTFLLAQKTSLGPVHWPLILHGAYDFIRFVPIGTWMLVTGGATLAGALWLTFHLPTTAPKKGVMGILLVASLYLLLLSPLVGFTIVVSVMPSRLLTLAGVGLALLVGLTASWALRLRHALLRWAIVGALAGWTGAEAIAMNSLLYEHQTSWAYDSHIRKQLLASGVRPQFGDTIFLSLPVHPLRRLWMTGFSQFQSGHVLVLLVYDYGMLTGHYDVPIEQRLRYKSEIRGGDDRADIAATPGHRIFCFSVSDGDYRLTPGSCGNSAAVR
jgi:hypothetical protein